MRQIAGILGIVTVALSFVCFFRSTEKRKFSLEIPTEIATHELACRTILSADVYQDGIEDDDKITAEVTRGTDNLAVRIDVESISIITAAAVKQGFSEASKWPIISDSVESLTAAGLQGDIIYTFTLNKRTGFAIWTKGQPTLFYIQRPSGFIQFLQCK